jgi:adenylate cyclase
MTNDDLFAREEEVMAAAEKRLSDGAFVSAEDRRQYEQLLKDYQKLFKTTRRLMRLSDRNEQQLNAMSEERRKAAELIALKNKELEALSKKLSKYLSPQIYHSIFTGAQTVEIAGSRKKLTIFFSDIANFTETTENLESEELTHLLNRYLTEMAEIALQFGATVDKYIGDAVVCFFGDPETRGVKEDACACVRMAIAMQRRMRELRAEWQELGATRPFEVRIGVNTGYCTVGNFGSEARMDYTIIGNTVNTTARIQSHTPLGGILLGHETYSLVKDDIACKALEPIKFKGIAEPVPCYEVLGIYDDLAADGLVIREERDGFKLLVDLQKQEKADAIEALEAVLKRLQG